MGNLNWEAKVRQVRPYTPGLQPAPDKELVKLNTNECPYPPSPKVRAAIESFDADLLRLYPSPDATPLTRALASHAHLSEENVFVGVGSDDVLALAFLTFFASGKPVYFPDITYSFYDVWADLFEIPYETKVLDDHFRIRAEDFYDAPGGLIFPNPNAPTGLAEPVSFVEDIVSHNPDSVVIVDEAYVDFGAESALPLIAKYENLLVVQTFSKSRSLAGLRVGCAYGSKHLISYLKSAKFAYNSYTMNRLTIEAGVAAVEDDAYFREICEKVIATRTKLEKELSALGFTFPQSSANFVFATHKEFHAKELYEALQTAKIYVRYFHLPRIDNYLRITVGTDEQTEKLCGFLKTYMGK